MPVKIESPGLRSLSRDLRRMKRDIDEGLRSEIVDAQRPIVRESQRLYARRYKQRTGRTRRSIKGTVSRRGAFNIRAGKTKRAKPYIWSQEFGSYKSKQFGPPRKGGAFFWPAVNTGLKKLEKDVDRMVTRSASRAGFN